MVSEDRSRAGASDLRVCRGLGLGLGLGFGLGLGLLGLGARGFDLHSARGRR